MHWLDHFFIFLLVVVQPVHGAWSYRTAVARIKAGEDIDVKTMYWQTISLQWAAFVVLLVSWALIGRPWYYLTGATSFGLGFYIGLLVVFAVCVYLALAARTVAEMTDEKKSGYIEGLGDTVYFMPRTRRDLLIFDLLSTTAGIVEEVIFRGFVIWYLLHFMPLWAAVLVSSVMFGLVHSYQGLGGGVKAGLVGLSLALLYVASGSIWLSIIAHIAIDTLQGRISVELLKPGKAEETPKPEAP
jgi:membrane protease YdiL (CAAX protease family)